MSTFCELDIRLEDNTVVKGRDYLTMMGLSEKLFLQSQIKKKKIATLFQILDQAGSLPYAQVQFRADSERGHQVTSSKFSKIEKMLYEAQLSLDSNELSTSHQAASALFNK